MDDETCLGLTNGTGHPMPEFTIEELADTARWIQWLAMWREVGWAAALWMSAVRMTVLA